MRKWEGIEAFYTLETSLLLPCAHRLELPYQSKCSNVHGHTYRFTFRFVRKELTSTGMVIDFYHLKNLVLKRFIAVHDHCMLNDVMAGNPTTENLARHAAEFVMLDLREFDPDRNVYLRSVTVWESPDNGVTYEIINIPN